MKKSFLILLIVVGLFFQPIHSYAFTQTSSDLNQFIAELLSLQDDLNNQLNSQELYAYVGNTSYSANNWASFFSLGETFVTHPTFGGFCGGIYFKDFTFTLPLTLPHF